MIVFAMMGMSSRFSKAGYVDPKYRLMLWGRPVFSHIVTQFSSCPDDMLFITPDDRFLANFILAECKSIGIEHNRVTIVHLNAHTKGQAETVSLGLEQANVAPNERIIVFNIDTIRLNFDLPSPETLEGCDGYLEVFEAPGDSWSFVKVADPDALEVGECAPAVQVVEKSRISDLCSNGLYFFRNRKVFDAAYTQMCAEPEAYKELYIAPMYQHMIDAGQQVLCRRVRHGDIIPCGTPDEYNAALKQKIPREINIPIRYFYQEILAIHQLGRNQKNFALIFDLLITARSQLGNKGFLALVNLTLDKFLNHDSLAFYSFAMHATRKDSQEYQDVLQRLWPGLVHAIMIACSEGNTKKSMNILAAIINLYRDKFLQIEKSVLQASFKEFSLESHKTIFRTIRYSGISGNRFVEAVVDLDQTPVRVTTLFVVYFMTKFKNVNRNRYLEYVEQNLNDAILDSDGDELRYSILKRQIAQETHALARPSKPKKAGKKGKPRKLKGALLLSGQLRGNNFSREFSKGSFLGDHKISTFISTWEKRGSPPSSVGRMRGYAPELQSIINTAMQLHKITAREFFNELNYVRPETISEQELDRDYLHEAKKIDDESALGIVFRSNQERLFYKVRDVFDLSQTVGEYDFYIRMRPDLYFDFDPAEFQDAIMECAENPNAIFIRKSHMYDTYFPFLDDNFAICGAVAMDRYSSIWPEFSAENSTMFLNSQNNIVPHATLAHWIMDSDLEVGTLSSLANFHFDGGRLISLREYREFLSQLEQKEHLSAFISNVLNAISETTLNSAKEDAYDVER